MSLPYIIFLYSSGTSTSITSFHFLSFLVLVPSFPSSFGLINIHLFVPFNSLSLFLPLPSSFIYIILFWVLDQFKIRAFCEEVCGFFILFDPMSKKMKRAAMDTPPLPPPPPLYEDAKTRLKHQALFQDFRDLLKEADDMRNKLAAAKERKLRLLAEVRFLRRRRKHLLEMKSLNQREVSSRNIESKSSVKGHNLQKREVALFKLPPLPDVKPKGKMYIGKESALRTPAPVLDLNRRQTLDGGKELSLRSLSLFSELNRRRLPSGKELVGHNTEPTIDLNLSQNMQAGNDTALDSRTPLFDLNQDSSFSGKEATFRGRAPIIDLNKISTEEEELQNTSKPLKFEEPKLSLTRGENKEQPNDLKLSVCRNAGEGISRMGKRKISCQDPVALRV